MACIKEVCLNVRGNASLARATLTARWYNLAPCRRRPSYTRESLYARILHKRTSACVFFSTFHGSKCTSEFQDTEIQTCTDHFMEASARLNSKTQRYTHVQTYSQAHNLGPWPFGRVPVVTMSVIVRRMTCDEMATFVERSQLNSARWRSSSRWSNARHRTMSAIV